MENHALGFAPALKAGLGEMVNPGGLMAIVFFTLFLWFFVWDRRLFWWGTLAFMLGNGEGRYLWTMGFLDKVLDWNPLLKVIGSFYLLFSIFCIGIGGRLALKWGRGFFSPEEDTTWWKRSLEAFGRTTSKKKWFFLVLIVFQSFLIGLLISLSQTVWGTSEHFLIILLQVLAPGREPAAYFLFLAYIVMVEIPFVLMTACLWIFLENEAGRAKLQRALGRLQLLGSAVFLSFGFSFLWVYGRTLLAIYRF